MTVGQLKKALEGLEDNTLVILPPTPYQPHTEATVIERMTLGGLDWRPSWETVEAICIADGSAGYMRERGCDILYPPKETSEVSSDRK
jgi:hypothetical protein